MQSGKPVCEFANDRAAVAAHKANEPRSVLHLTVSGSWHSLFVPFERARRVVPFESPGRKAGAFFVQLISGQQLVNVGDAA